jgi:hypothetical protein
MTQIPILPTPTDRVSVPVPTFDPPRPAVSPNPKGPSAKEQLAHSLLVAVATAVTDAFASWWLHRRGRP